jgi:hypothetical protein
MAAMTRLRQLLGWMGPLRLMLVAGSLLLVVLRPVPGTPPVYSGWELMPTLVFPALMPLFFMVLLLDAIMGGVWLASYPAERARYRAMIAVSLATALLLLLRWWPYFGALAR